MLASLRKNPQKPRPTEPTIPMGPWRQHPTLDLAGKKRFWNLPLTPFTACLCEAPALTKRMSHARRPELLTRAKKSSRRIANFCSGTSVTVTRTDQVICTADKVGSIYRKSLSRDGTTGREQCAPGIVQATPARPEGRRRDGRVGVGTAQIIVQVNLSLHDTTYSPPGHGNGVRQ